MTSLMQIVEFNQPAISIVVAIIIALLIVVSMFTLIIRSMSSSE